MSLEKAKEVVNRIQVNQSGFKQPARAVEDNNHPKVVNTMTELFTRLKAITAVGNAFNSESEHIVKQEWVLAFALEGVKSQKVIDRGVEAMRAKARKSRGTTWFPSIGEFVDACLGSDNKLEAAERAYRIFSNPKWKEKQTCNVGQMVVSGYSFELRQLKSAECKKRFIELYLEFAADNEIELLDAFALTETVQLTPEQQKGAEKRKQDAQKEHLAKLNSMFGGIPKKDKPKAKVKVAKHGVVTGKIKTAHKSQAACDKERERQLKLIKDRL